MSDRSIYMPTTHKPIITNELLSEYIGKKVYWHEVDGHPMFIKCHLDQDRYLGETQTVNTLDINKFINDNGKE